MSAWLGLPELASEQGQPVDNLLLWVHVFIAAVIVAWMIFGIYVLVRFRRKRQPQAIHEGAKSHATFYFEAGIFAFELLLLFGFSVPFWASQVAAAPDSAEAGIEVRVIAQQFAWNVHYPGADGTFGATRPEFIDDQSNPVGIDREDPNGKDDIVTLNQLVLPVDQLALVRLTSKDVVHSFGLPELRVKQDAIPGLQSFARFTPTVTTAEFQKIKGDPARTFEIVCSQLCGLGHYRMRGFLTVLPGEEFAQWLVENAPSEEDADYDPFWE